MDQRVVSGWALTVLEGVIVKHEIPGRPGRLAAVTCDTTPLEDRPDVAVIFDIQDAPDVTQAGLVLDVPLLPRLIMLPVCQQGSQPGQVKDLVIVPGGSGVLEECRLLAVSVAA